jgi:hypothetical protein
MPECSTTVLESQLDWLTCSYRGADKARALRNFAMDAQSLEAREGNDTKRWQLNGYEGFRTGRVRYGDRDNACLLQLSGQLAEDWAGSVLPDATTITRVDLAVTVRPSSPVPAYGARAYAELAEWHQAHPLSAVPSATHDANGGWTTYLGARRSPLFLRIYDKGAEAASRDDRAGLARYADCWRFELECHDVAAKAYGLAAVLAGNRSAYVSGALADYLEHHGLEPMFETTCHPASPGAFARRTDYASRLRWFASKVAPSIRLAMSQGDPQEVIDALGLGPEPAESLT